MFDFNALAFIYNYMKFVLPSLLSMSWTHAETVVVWISSSDFADKRDSEQLLADACKKLVKQRGWHAKHQVRDEGTLSIDFINKNGVNKTASFKRLILKEPLGFREIELIYDFLPFRDEVNAVYDSDMMTRIECEELYDNYKKTILNYVAAYHDNKPIILFL